MTLTNEATGAKTVLVGAKTLYKVKGKVKPGDFKALRVKANRELTSAELERLHGLVDYLWVTVVRGQALKSYIKDTDRSFTANASLSRSFSSKPKVRMNEFLEALNDFIAEGSPRRTTMGNTRLIEGIPNVKVSVWLSHVEKK